MGQGSFFQQFLGTRRSTEDRRPHISCAIVLVSLLLCRRCTQTVRRAGSACFDGRLRARVLGAMVSLVFVAALNMRRQSAP